jgi:hypothetical protein
VIAYDPREEPPDRQRPSGLGAGLPLQVPPADTRRVSLMVLTPLSTMF